MQMSEGLYAAALGLVLTACQQQTPTPEAASKADAPAAPKAATLEMVPVGPETRIIGGAPASAAMFRATLLYTGADGTLCTSTVVGERAVLTAAHCLPKTGGSGSIKLGGAAIPITCSPNPGFAACGSDPMAAGCGQDTGLCLAASPITAKDLKYEVVNTQASKVVVGSSATIVGYGCTEAGSAPQPLQVGASKIGANVTAGGTGEQQFIRLTGTAYACKGDSGGGAFDTSDPAKRLVIGVVSNVDAPAVTRLAAPHEARNLAFIKNWAATKGVKICGVHSDATGCR